MLVFRITANYHVNVLISTQNVDEDDATEQAENTKYRLHVKDQKDVVLHHEARDVHAEAR